MLLPASSSSAALVKCRDRICSIPPVEVLHALFTDFNELRPERTSARTTRAAASDLLRLAEQLELDTRPTPLTREQIGHLLMRIVLCLFADSIGLLPEHTFRDLVLSQDRFLPRKFRRKLRPLFQAMSEEDGIFGPHSIPYFNGGLFDDDNVIELDLEISPSSPRRPGTIGRISNAPSLARSSSDRSTPPSAR